MPKVKIKKKTVSYSQYSVWSNCPLQWKLNSVDKVGTRDESIHLVFGTAMHDTVQQWLDIIFNPKGKPGRSLLVARTMDLSDILQERMIADFKKRIYKENKQTVFPCDRQSLMEFYLDGVKILKWLQNHMDKFFSVLEWTLEGVEVPLSLDIMPNVKFRGYLDVVLRHKLTGEIRIIDLKTSTRGWNKWKKGDRSVTDQLLLYKAYYSKKFNISEHAISVQYYILKRKLPDESDWPIPRVSSFVPAHGKISMKSTKERFQKFLDACFTTDGEYILEQKPTPSKHACRFCPFNQTEHCSVGVEVK